MEELEALRKKRHGEVSITITLRYGEPPQLSIEPKGRCKSSELDEAYYALRSAFSTKYRIYKKPITRSQAVLEAIDEDWHKRQIRNWLDEHRDERIAFELPWLCEFENCQRRFSTERGAEIHERSCRHKPESTP